MNNQIHSSLDVGQAGITSFWLKMAAITGMLCNHIANMYAVYLPFEVTCVLYGLGGIAFPIMAYLLVEGYKHTSNLKRYMLRLLVFALLSQIPYWLFLAHQGNVLFTLLLSLIVLYAYDRLKNRGLFFLVFLVAIILGFFLDWGSIGVIMVFLFSTLGGSRYKRILLPLLIPLLVIGLPSALLLLSESSLYSLPELLYAVIGGAGTAILLLLYKGVRGPSAKYLFYVFYPSHILILGLIKGIVLGDWSPGI